MAAPATVVVTLPASAKLTVDGSATSSTSAVRTFVSPTLLPNRDYTYTLTADRVRATTPSLWASSSRCMTIFIPVPTMVLVSII